jgi:hypothetical protein
MKKITLLLFISFSCFAQEDKFTFSEKGFTDYIVTNCPDKTKEEIYSKVIDWISIIYNTPKEVIKGEIINDYIRIEGIKKNVALGTLLGMPTVDNYKYQIEISVKDSKYKLDVINIENYTSPSQYITGGWNSINITNTSSYYKNGKIRTSVKFLPESLPEIFNELNRSLSNFILKNETTTKKSDW